MPRTRPSRLAVSDDLRVGHGYDRHRLAHAGREPQVRPLIIGGVRVRHACGVVAHSDGDALLHAVADAIFGALGSPDLGRLFPDRDRRWANADSARFVRHAVRRARAGGWAVANLDATVILQSPRIAPARGRIRRNLARLLGVPLTRVNVKGKTGEGLDAVGRGQAIEAHAVVLLQRVAQRR